MESFHCMLYSTNIGRGFWKATIVCCVLRLCTQLLLLVDIGIFPVVKVKHVLTFLLVHTHVVITSDRHLYQLFVSKNWCMQLKGVITLPILR